MGPSGADGGQLVPAHGCGDGGHQHIVHLRGDYGMKTASGLRARGDDGGQQRRRCRGRRSQHTPKTFVPRKCRPSGRGDDGNSLAITGRTAVVRVTKGCGDDRRLGNSGCPMTCARPTGTGTTGEPPGRSLRPARRAHGRGGRRAADEGGPRSLACGPRVARGRRIRAQEGRTMTEQEVRKWLGIAGPVRPEAIEALSDVPLPATNDEKIAVYAQFLRCRLGPARQDELAPTAAPGR
jgi:hypothetical protein